MLALSLNHNQFFIVHVVRLKKCNDDWHPVQGDAKGMTTGVVLLYTPSGAIKESRRLSIRRHWGQSER